MKRGDKGLSVRLIQRIELCHIIPLKTKLMMEYTTMIERLNKTAGDNISNDKTRDKKVKTCVMSLWLIIEGLTSYKLKKLEEKMPSKQTLREEAVMEWNKGGTAEAISEE